MRQKGLQVPVIDEVKLLLGCESTLHRFSPVMVVVIIQRRCNKNDTKVFTGMQVKGVSGNQDLILRIDCVVWYISGIFDDRIFTIRIVVGSHEGRRK